MRTQNNPLKNVLGVMLLILTIGCITGTIFAFKSVLSSIVYPLLVSVFIGFATALPLRKMWIWLTGSSNVTLTIILNLILIIPLSLCLIFLINDTKRKDEIIEPAEVVKVYSKTRHQTKRAGRNHYVQGAPYKVYFIELDPVHYPSIDIEITRKEYARIQKGDSVKLPVYTGMLGITRFDRAGIVYPSKATVTRKRETMRQRRHRAYREHINNVLNRNEQHNNDN